MNCICRVFNLEKKGEGNEPTIKGLPHLFCTETLSQLTEEDKQLGPMKTALENKNFDAFKRISPGLQQFFHHSYVSKQGIVVVDSRIAVPSCLRQAVLSWIHRDHPGQQAMIDLVANLWWPGIHRQVVEKADKCDTCRKYGKNLKSLIPKQVHSTQIARLKLTY